jgi:uncharacterized cupin superfamily protein
VPEAPLAEAASGLVPAGEGWFVVNAADAAWVTNDAFGARCPFEANGPAVRKNPELVERTFSQLGFGLYVLEPGKPSGLYHAESEREGFLVLAGECVLLVEEEERRLRAWDFFHCPPGTRHAFVGSGDAPCVILMVGARTAKRTIVYPDSDLARRRGAGVVTETDSSREAYAQYPHWQPERLLDESLPWAAS